MVSRAARARLSAVAVAFACCAATRYAAALSCGTPPPRLEFTYPDASTPAIAPGAVFWAVGTNEVVLIAAYLDASVKLEPGGAAPPANWLFVPPAPLAPGNHTLEFVFENLLDRDQEEVLVEFKVSEAAAAEHAADAVPLVFTGTLRFPVYSKLLGPERVGIADEIWRLMALEGDCTDRVSRQRELCYWFEHGVMPDIWGRGAYVEGQPLWTGLESRGDVLGHVMGERFVPASCRGVYWQEDRFGERVEAIPLYPDGFGSAVVLEDQEIRDWELPPPLERKHETSPFACSFAPQRPFGVSLASLLVLGASALARRRAKHCQTWIPTPQVPPQKSSRRSLVRTRTMRESTLRSRASVD